LEFVAANPGEARSVLGAEPWQRVNAAHSSSWFGRSPGYRINAVSTMQTTSTITHSRRSLPRCR
ncbi:hypothetical protein, partial [Mycolicibacterium vanbaalenii]|uniref:hypothetical protein n=1 Tax=Mycolicibacterium vanbaalenii TaxID=110539 RepID=UPI0021F35ED5